MNYYGENKEWIDEKSHTNPIGYVIEIIRSNGDLHKKPSPKENKKLAEEAKKLAEEQGCQSRFSVKITQVEIINGSHYWYFEFEDPLFKEKFFERLHKMGLKFKINTEHAYSLESEKT